MSVILRCTCCTKGTDFYEKNHNSYQKDAGSFFRLVSDVYDEKRDFALTCIQEITASPRGIFNHLVHSALIWFSVHFMNVKQLCLQSFVLKSSCDRSQFMTHEQKAFNVVTEKLCVKIWVIGNKNDDANYYLNDSTSSCYTKGNSVHFLRAQKIGYKYEQNF